MRESDSPQNLQHSLTTNSAEVWGSGKLTPGSPQQARKSAPRFSRPERSSSRCSSGLPRSSAAAETNAASAIRTRRGPFLATRPSPGGHGIAWWPLCLRRMGRARRGRLESSERNLSQRRAVAREESAEPGPLQRDRRPHQAVLTPIAARDPPLGNITQCHNTRALSGSGRTAVHAAVDRSNGQHPLPYTHCDELAHEHCGALANACPPRLPSKGTRAQRRAESEAAMAPATSTKQKRLGLL